MLTVYLSSQTKGWIPQKKKKEQTNKLTKGWKNLMEFVKHYV